MNICLSPYSPESRVITGVGLTAAVDAVQDSSPSRDLGPLFHDGPVESGGRHPSDGSGSNFSPDGSIRLDMLVSEWSVSLWTHGPRLVEAESGKVLLDLWGTGWDAQTAWTEHSGMRIDLRRYDWPGSITVFVFFGDWTFRVLQDGRRPRPLTDFRAGLHSAFGDANRRFCQSLSGEDIPEPPPVADIGAPVTKKRLNLLGQQGRKYNRVFVMRVWRRLITIISRST